MSSPLPKKHFSLESLKLISDEFRDLVSKGGVSSNSFKNKFESAKLFSGRFLQVLYIGGSHVESALIDTREGNKIVEFIEEGIPFFSSEKDFLELVARMYNPKAVNLTINIAAPLQNISRAGVLDAILVKGHRNHNFGTLVGKVIGQEVEKYLHLIGYPNTKVGSCNNLVSLGYLSKSQNLKPSQTIAAVVATGVNLGFFENENEFINLESGKYSISGIEVSELIGESGILKSYNLEAQRFGFEGVEERQDLLNLLKKDTEAGGLAKSVIRRSAQLFAAKLFGLISFKSEQETNFTSNKIDLVVEGFLFWQYPNYKEMVLETLELLGLNLKKINLIKTNFGFVYGAVKMWVFDVVLERKIVADIQRVYGLVKSFTFELRGPPLSI